MLQKKIIILIQIIVFSVIIISIFETKHNCQCTRKYDNYSVKYDTSVVIFRNKKHANFGVWSFLFVQIVGNFFRPSSGFQCSTLMDHKFSSDRLSVGHTAEYDMVRGRNDLHFPTLSPSRPGRASATESGEACATGTLTFIMSRTSYPVHYSNIILCARVQGGVQPAQLIRSDHVPSRFRARTDVFQTDLG